MKTRNIILGLVLSVFLVMGVNAVNSSVSVTLNTPAAAIWDTDRVINFSCIATPSIYSLTNISNISLMIDGKRNATWAESATTANTSVTANFTITFDTDSCTARYWTCEAQNNETNISTVANRSFYLDATSPTVTCDRGSDYFTIKRGDTIYFTDSDVCGISTRQWSNDAGATVSSTFLDTNDVDTHGWERTAYNVNLTSCDAAGLCGDATCYISSMGKRTAGEQIIVESDQPIVLTQEGLTTTTEKAQDNSVWMFVILGGGVLLLFSLTRSKRGKKGRKK